MITLLENFIKNITTHTIGLKYTRVRGLSPCYRGQRFREWERAIACNLCLCRRITSLHWWHSLLCFISHLFWFTPFREPLFHQYIYIFFFYYHYEMLSRCNVSSFLVVTCHGHVSEFNPSTFSGQWLSKRYLITTSSESL